MAELPAGTVTLWFTDIEGSTRLLERLGDRYVEVLANHRRLLRAAFAQFGGRGRATSARKPALARWLSAGADGTPHRRADHRRRELCRSRRAPSGAHLLGWAWRAGPALSGHLRAAGRGLPPGVGLRDLGQHRLKDITRPLRLFQLVISGLPSGFPSLRTLDAHPVKLPTPLTRFIGRQQELADVGALLQRDECACSP